jgi:hypothetical protein
VWKEREAASKRQERTSERVDYWRRERKKGRTKGSEDVRE